MLYLLQLVQALKFERIDDKTEASYDSSLVQFLIERAINNPILGTYLYWYVMVECQDKKYGKMYAKVAFHFFGELLQVKIWILTSLCHLMWIIDTRRLYQKGRAKTSRSINR